MSRVPTALFSLLLNNSAMAATQDAMAEAWLWMILGLVLVVGLIFGLAYLAKRTGLAERLKDLRGQRMRAIAALSLGGREKLILVAIHDRELLLGVAPGNVRLLKSFPASIETSAPASPFALQWRKVMGQQSQAETP